MMVMSDFWPKVVDFELGYGADTMFHRTYFLLKMILLLYFSSSIKDTEILDSILYLSFLRPAIYVCV